MMIPDSTKRLQQTADDLAEFSQQQQQQVDTAEWYRRLKIFKRARSGGVREIGQTRHRKQPTSTTGSDEAF
jgi:hypothetical protein